MAVEVRPALRIARPPEAVRELWFDPLSAPRWSTTVRGVAPISDGPVREGYRYRAWGRILGRSFEMDYVVTATDGRTFQERWSDDPFPHRLTYLVEPDGDGSWVTLHGWGEVRGFFARAEPIVEPLLRAALHENLRRLRTLLEAGG